MQRAAEELHAAAEPPVAPQRNNLYEVGRRCRRFRFDVIATRTGSGGGKMRGSRKSRFRVEGQMRLRTRFLEAWVAAPKKVSEHPSSRELGSGPAWI